MVASFNIADAFIAVIWAVILLSPAVGLYMAVQWLVARPFKFLERARFLLEMVRVGLKDGRSPERTILSLCHVHGHALDVPIHLLSAEIEQGRTFAESVERVPGVMPPSAVAMLKVGEEIKDLPAVIPAAIKTLQDGMAEARLSQYHTVAMGTATTLVLMLVISVLSTWVFPKLDYILLEADDGRNLVGWMMMNVFTGHLQPWLISLGAFVAALWLWITLCLGGMERMFWLQSRAPRVAAAIWHWLPWRYKRLQRDFSYLLAVMLDARVPEAHAVTMAASGTANPGMTRRAARVVQDLSDGLWLPSAIRHVDDDGQLQWRMSNAVCNQAGFVAALRTWHESLETTAMKQERVAIDSTNLAVTLIHGLLVGWFCASILQFYTTLADLSSPW